MNDRYNYLVVKINENPDGLTLDEMDEILNTISDEYYWKEIAQIAIDRLRTLQSLPGIVVGFDGGTSVLKGE
jgi:hypothetical protein